MELRKRRIRASMNPRNGPPPSGSTVPSASEQRDNRWAGVITLCLSVLGAFCLLIGSSAPSTRGLSGQAFEEAFEANEDVMFYPVLGFILVILGLNMGLIYRRMWAGKIAVATTFLSFAWFLLRVSK